ncbi:hypothetical protein [Paracoccus beibuensis]|uniref:hypothetical protein n=1 Tax=Paracoccus beibuensis TaxID=547602 RepID=UPI00223EDF0A|nr:hypothetical protein [Paracoccus beibuensis]
MAKIDIRRAIAPKSDQLNADDLLAGPHTIRINGVREGSAEQPVHVFFDGDNGRPWKPSKTALRCLVAIWGDDPDRWVGMSLTIYTDPNVRFGKDVVGGIRVSAMEGLSQPRTLSLTTTRGKRAPTTIQPLKVEAKKGPADQWKERLFGVAEGGKGISVADAWAKVPDTIRDELGAGIYDQLIALEAAAKDYRENDPNAAVDALNESLG